MADALGCDPVELIGGARLDDAELRLLAAYRAGDLKALMRIAMKRVDE